ncbi:MAG: hypothetical protein KME19_14095 [Microcoleus vaginatus WJT46-NPBG5]|nr:hypothetical protein [Microcoleus vaginatus WJT46-NPBG5]
MTSITLRIASALALDCVQIGVDDRCLLLPAGWRHPMPVLTSHSDKRLNSPLTFNNSHRHSLFTGTGKSFYQKLIKSR